MTFEQEMKVFGYALQLANEFDYVPSEDDYSFDRICDGIAETETAREWCRLAINRHCGYSHSDLVSCLTAKFRNLEVELPNV